MSNTIKLPDYNSVENLNDTDILLVNQNGQNKKVTKEKLLEDVTASLNDNTQNIATNTSDIVTLKTSKQDKITDSGWIDLAFTQGTSVANFPARYRKIGNVVYLEGRVTGLAETGFFATLPSGYRPKQNLLTICAMGGIIICKVEIRTDGQIQLAGISESITTSSYFSLSNISYIVD